MTTPAPTPSTLKVVLAFAAVYIIWGSTYFFIADALKGFPPMMLGAIRFIAASLLMFGWAYSNGMKLWPGKHLSSILVVGFLLLFVGNGMVVWVEQSVPSGVVAIMIAAAPLWFVLLDRPNWGVNLRSVPTVLGVLAGFAGVLLLFSARLAEQLERTELSPEVAALGLLTFSAMCWVWGSLYAKRNPVPVDALVNTAWQMATAAVAFSIAAILRGEPAEFVPTDVPVHAWWSLAYLAVFGSIVGYSAYVWLLGVRPAMQVSTYAYVNPVVAVLLGAYVGGEVITGREVGGLAVILGSVLAINLAKYRKERKARA